MTQSPEAAIAEVADALDAIDDPEVRFREARRVEQLLDSTLRGVRQRVALQLKERMTWRRVGEAMGDVSAQRAEQISRGV
jgi:hypothetical protein